MKECNYKCTWEPNRNKKYKINTDTYTLNFIKDSVYEIKDLIKNIYRIDIIYTLEDIISFVKKDINVETEYINLAIYDLIKNKDIVYDKFNREGYIIIKGNYFIFQPMEIKDKYIPMYYRNIPLKIKPSKFTIIDKIEKINKINNETNNDIDIDKKINNLKEKFKDFNIIYIIKLVLNRYLYK